MSTSRPKHRQYAALPYRVTDAGELQVLMITSRGTGRWILPKGWPMKGKKPHEAAAQEALEEAGLKGRVAPAPICSYLYDKHDDDKVRQCKVKVFPLRVTRQLEVWPEKHQRQCLWCTPLQAASLASDEGLRPTLAGLQDLLAAKNGAQAIRA